MPLGKPVDAPWGFVALCGRSPIDCVYDDTPQARAQAVLAARALARARWDRAIQKTSCHDVISCSRQTASLHHEPAGPEQGSSVADETRPLSSTAAAAAEPPEPVELDAKTWRSLKRINARVNRAIHPASDMEAYGVRDWWVAPLSSGLAPLGDCKDYALEKRRELISAGVPARALTLALARTPSGELHAVLVIATRQGDYVLDNLARQVRLWSDTPYAWRSRQSPTDPLVWLLVEAGRRPDAPKPTFGWFGWLRFLLKASARKADRAGVTVASTASISRSTAQSSVGSCSEGSGDSAPPC